jgi:hypothetical protein
MAEMHREPIGDQVRRGIDELQEVRLEMMDVLADVGTLAQKELELARVEMAEQLASARSAVTFGVIAALFALLTLAFLATAAMFGLAEVVDLWLASLITAGGLAAITLMLGALAYQQIKQVTVAPKKTMETVSEDVRWARSRMNFNGRSASTGRT